MKNMSESPIIRKAMSLYRSLADIRLKEEHRITLKLYNASAPEESECNQSIHGCSDHSLIKMISVIGILALIMTAFCTLCSLLKD